MRNTQPFWCAILLAVATAQAPAQTWNLELLSGATEAHSALSDSGDLLVGWSSNGIGHFARLDVDGRLTELRAVAAPQNLSISAVAFDGTERTVIAGHINARPWIGVIDRAGTMAWSDVGSSEAGYYRGVLLLADGDVLAYGHEAVTSGGRRPLVTRYSPGGSVQWRRSYDHAGGRGDFYAAVQTSDDGILLAADIRDVTSSTDWFVLRLDANGSELWTRLYDANDGAYSPCLCLAPDDGFYLAGVQALVSNSNNTSTAVVRCDANGNVVWSRGFWSYISQRFSGSTLQTGGIAPRRGGGVGVLSAQPMARAPHEEDLALLLVDAGGNADSYRNLGAATHHEKAGEIHATAGGGFALVGAYENDRVIVQRVDDDGLTTCPPVSDIFNYAQPMTITVTPLSLTPRSVVPSLTQYGVTTQPSILTLQFQCANLCRVQPSSFGLGKAGSGGFVPRLSSASAYCVNNTPVMDLDQTLGGTRGFLMFAGASAALPLFGGTLHIDPTSLVSLPIDTGGIPGAAGTGDYQFRIPGNLTGLSGASFYVQALVLDPSATFGLSMSEAIRFAIQ